MTHRLTRRGMVSAALAAALAAGPRQLAAQPASPAFGYPVGLPGHVLGDGFLVRHGYATENTWYNPGWWHTGEDWYLPEGETGGVGVHAAAAGEVVFAGSEYPGLVVIILHGGDLYSVYGHLDYALSVEAGQRVSRGDLLGTVLARADDYARSHLHFELRTFFTEEEINGESPQHGVSCGFECPPGPGYWPMTAPEHPSDLGWLNPTHVINRRAWPGEVPPGTMVIVAEGAPASAALWSVPAENAGAEVLGELALLSGENYPLREIATGTEAATGTSAEATRLWYRIALAGGAAAWVQATAPVPLDSGTDGRPSSLRFSFLPMIVT